MIIGQLKYASYVRVRRLCSQQKQILQKVFAKKWETGHRKQKHAFGFSSGIFLNNENHKAFISCMCNEIDTQL